MFVAAALDLCTRSRLGANVSEVREAWSVVVHIDWQSSGSSAWSHDNYYDWKVVGMCEHLCCCCYYCYWAPNSQVSLAGPESAKPLCLCDCLRRNYREIDCRSLHFRCSVLRKYCCWCFVVLSTSSPLLAAELEELVTQTLRDWIVSHSGCLLVEGLTVTTLESPDLLDGCSSGPLNSCQDEGTACRQDIVQQIPWLLLSMAIYSDISLYMNLCVCTVCDLYLVIVWLYRIKYFLSVLKKHWLDIVD